MLEHGRLFTDPIDDPNTLMGASSYPFRIAATEERITAELSDRGVIDQSDVDRADEVLGAPFQQESVGGLE